MTSQIGFKPTLPLEVWCILLQYLNVKNLQIHFNSTAIFTYSYKFGQPKKQEIYIIISQNSIWMHITYVINQHHSNKIKDYPHVDH
jgi:hypothetical protein